MNRTKIKIKWEVSDFFIEGLGLFFLIVMIGFPAYYYNELPDVIPTHYDGLGQPDSFGSKGSLWTLPVMGLFMYIGLFVLNGFPHIFNYPTEITEENAERQYRMATKLLRTLNLMVTGSFFYIGYGTIQTARNQQAGLGTWFLPVFLGAMALIIAVYMYFALRKNKESTPDTTI